MMLETTLQRMSHRLLRFRPRSGLRTAVTAAELKGMRSIRRLGRDRWEQLSEAQRIAMARARRRSPRDPDDVA